MNGMKQFLSALLLFMGALAGPASADVLLQVHGYQGSIYSWEQSGVNNVLQQFGWKRAALLLGSPEGLIPVSQQWQDADNKVVNLLLNSEAPLNGQANVFSAALRWVNDRYPADKIIIVGHSLGGVVARLALIRHGAPNVKALITIASPHLGTALAYHGLDEVSDPFPINKIKEFFGGSRYDTLIRSKGMLHDILPAIPGRLLHWLNTRAHPPIQYFSVVRSGFNGALGDPIVPGFSQDMANVEAIGKSSTRLIQGFSHELSVLDGYALVNILTQLEKK
ncbi:MAG: alpha/beta fold hydrolase [Gammaproteobacteria bacterium]|nr:alpha/beta fold hydrolase [Gammaproteobacteria bacterium]